MVATNSIRFVELGSATRNEEILCTFDGFIILRLKHAAMLLMLNGAIIYLEQNKLPDVGFCRCLYLE